MTAQEGQAPEEDKLAAPSESTVERYNAEQTQALSIRSVDDIKRLSLIFVESGMFKADDRLSEKQRLYQAGVKIIAGVEFGIQPFAAMRGINIIKGNAEMSANLMAAKVKKHPKYDYRVKQWDRDGCVLTFYEIPYPGAPKADWEELGESSFDLEDAKLAGLAGGDNWRKFARNMYFARAMSNGVRIYTPDVFYGAPVYVEGEISGDFNPPAVAEPQELTDKPEPQEAEVVEPTGEESPDDEPEDVTDDPDLSTTSIVRDFEELGLTTSEIRGIVRDVTGKPFLANCTPEELQKVVEAIDHLRTERAAS